MDASLQDRTGQDSTVQPPSKPSRSKVHKKIQETRYDHTSDHTSHMNSYEDTTKKKRKGSGDVYNTNFLLLY